MDSYDTLDRMPQRAEEALETAYAAARAVGGRVWRAVALDGEGEGALAATLIVAALTGICSAPCVDVFDASLPAFVNADTLVVALAAGGSEDSTVSVSGAAADAGAGLAIVAPPGHLIDMAAAQGFPMCRLPVSAPTTSRLCELFFGGLGMCAGLCREIVLDGDLMTAGRSALDLLRRQRRALGPEADPRSNPARLIADALKASGPLVYGSSVVERAAARVWEDRLRGAGLPAVAGDVDRDSVRFGWPAQPAPGVREPNVPALLLLAGAVPAAKRDWTLRLRAALGTLVCHELVLDGNSAVERLAGALYLAEWTAFFLMP
ncbi:MAG: hypothetical protein ACLQVD_16495 [Capsulimonadaceae bacterium]